MKTKITFFLMTFLLLAFGQSYAASTTIPVSLTATTADLQTAMADAVTAGNTDITLEFASGYTLGTTASGGDVTLAVPAGVTKLTFFASPAVAVMPVLSLNTLTYSDDLMTDGIVFDGVKLHTGTTNRYLIQPSASSATKIPAKLLIRNCWVEGYRAVMFSTLVTTTSELNFYNNYFKNIANGGIISVSAGNIPMINIRNNTFNNVGGVASGATGSDYFIDYRSTYSVSSQINFSNNTIYYPATQGRGLFRLSSGTFTTGYIKENNNLYATGNAASFSLQLLYTNSSGAISDADSVNYISSMMTLGSNKGAILTEVYTENSPSNLFMNPALDDFTITDPNFAGKSVAGDPRWFPKAITDSVRVTTSVSPAEAGSVTPSSIAVNSGSSVTLTATANFGYAFKEWKGLISGTVVSTSSQYTLSPNSDTSLVAVFDVLTTYNFNLNYDGAGSNWGNVSLSPLPTNGKYVAGTQVTAAVVPNAVSAFQKWNDNSTELSKTITVNEDISLIASFDVVPFISGWDFKVGEPRNTRDGDYFYDELNKGSLNIYNGDGSGTSWLSHAGWSSPATPCAILWTGSADFASNRRYWQATFSTLGRKTVQVKSQMAGSYQYYTKQKLQASLNGTDFTDISSLDLSASWADLNAVLSSDYDDKATVYLRWVGDASSALVGTGNDGTSLTNVYVFADFVDNGGVTETINPDQSSLYAYKMNNQYIVNNIPADSKIQVYSLTGSLQQEMLSSEGSVAIPAVHACIVKVSSKNLVQVIKLF